MGLLRTLQRYITKQIRYKFLSFKGESSSSSDISDNELVGAIVDCIATHVSKLTPQVIRNVDGKRIVKEDHLGKLLGLRWAPEMSCQQALYKLVSILGEQSDAFALIMYNDDFTQIDRIVPINVHSARVFEDENQRIWLKFIWDYDNKEYVYPYSMTIHLRSRYNKRRFLGTAPGLHLDSVIELMDKTNDNLKSVVKNSSGLMGYLQYNNFVDDDELKTKAEDFTKSYLEASKGVGVAALDSNTTFNPITLATEPISVNHWEHLERKMFKYYHINEKILESDFDDKIWNAFYESVIEPIAVQLSLECTYKVLSAGERNHGSKIIFTSNRLQYASLTTRATIGKDMFDRGAITVDEYRDNIGYGPLPDGTGNVRMVSLNYVKASEQSIYQIGTEKGGEDSAE